MKQNARARNPREQSAMTRQRLELMLGHRGEDCHDPLTEPCELARDELELLRGKLAGHRWDGWRRLTADEGYFAACSCGWRGTETGGVSPMLRQVKEHLDAVRAVRGGWPSTRTAPVRDRRERSAGQRKIQPDERTRELYASVQGQHRRLCQALERSAHLLAATHEQADRLVAVLEHVAANVAPDWARTQAAAQSPETLQRRADRAKELRTGIIAAAGTLAVIAEEIAVAGQDLETRCSSGPAENRPAEAGGGMGRPGGGWSRGCVRLGRPRRGGGRSRVEAELGDLRQMVGEPGNPQQGVAQGLSRSRPSRPGTWVRGDEPELVRAMPICSPRNVTTALKDMAPPMAG
jgi:hypothetical protein